MAIMAKSGGGSGFKPVSAGLHPAVCTRVIDLGVQEGSERFPKPKHRVYLGWVCTDEQVEWEKDGQKHTGPAFVGQTYTLSLGENSRLRPLLESWRGRPFTEVELKGFDISKLAGVPCQIQILHETRGEKTYANVAAIVPWPKGVPVPTVDPPVVYSPSEHSAAVYNDLPQWLRETIDKRLANTYEELDRGREPTQESVQGDVGGFSDEIPFLPCEYRSVA